jgi:redox-sensitive bicupin YhaK (pirin superfamily)
MVLNAMTARAAWTHSVTVQAGATIPTPSPGGVAFLVVLEGSITIDGQNASARDAFRIEEAVAPRAAANTRAALIRIIPARPSGRGIEAP